MRLMWFHLMPYTELPDGFRDKHPSVWVDIHSSLFDPRRAHHMYNDFMDELEHAADCGGEIQRRFAGDLLRRRLWIRDAGHTDRV